MFDIIERIIKILNKFNCISNTSKIEHHSNKIKDLEDDLEKIRDKIESNRYMIEAKLENYYDKDHLKDVINTIRQQVRNNEDQISMNHNLLYEKHQEISDKLHTEVRKNSIGLAEIKGILIRKQHPSWK